MVFCALKTISSDPMFSVVFTGIPTLVYGISSWMLIRVQEDVVTSKGTVTIYFLLPEDRNSVN